MSSSVVVLLINNSKMLNVDYIVDFSLTYGMGLSWLLFRFHIVFLLGF